jgi:hypothetical protein
MADTKRTILAAIRDQIRPAIGKRPDSPRWSPQHWWEAFQYLVRIQQQPQQQDPTIHPMQPQLTPNTVLQFIYSSGVSEQHQDDLLFFVRREAAAGSTALPFFVRRRMARLPEELQLSGKDFSSVDWEATVILNIVLQSQYQLTVVACGWVAPLLTCTHANSSRLHIEPILQTHKPPLGCQPAQ